MIGAHLSSEAQQRLSASVTSPDAPFISEDFSDIGALKRFHVGAPDLGFKAGSSDLPPWSIKDQALIGRPMSA